jgi:hypothetical protein
LLNFVAKLFPQLVADPKNLSRWLRAASPLTILRTPFNGSALIN